MVERIVARARKAPTAGFSQGLRFVVVTDPELRGAVARAGGEEWYRERGFGAGMFGLHDTAACRQALEIPQGRDSHRRRHDRAPGPGRRHGLALEVPVEASRRGRALGTLVERLAAARIGATFNQYSRSQLRRERLEAYLDSRREAPTLLVGEAAGYRGARVSGLPFTSERQLTGTGPAEASATIVHRVLAELGLEDDVLLWNVVPTHPHEPGRPWTNRSPTSGEVASSASFLEQLSRGRRVIALGRLAEAVTGAPYARHPSHGGAAALRAGLTAALTRS